MADRLRVGRDFNGEVKFSRSLELKAGKSTQLLKYIFCGEYISRYIGGDLQTAFNTV